MKAIDLFAGAGGFTEGIKQSGISVIWAANHWQIAVDAHSKNHPETIHSCQDLQQADWSKVPKHNLLLASPACQGHSRARGKEKPHHDIARSTAWAVISCLEYHQPYFIVVENVKEFRNWKLYPIWKSALNTLGYSVSENIINAQYHSVPQSRERLFIVCTKSKNPLVLDLKKNESLIPAKEVIDFNKGKWTGIFDKKRSPKTLDKFYNSKKVFGDSFLIAYYGNEDKGRSIDKPLGTITTIDRFAIVYKDKMRMLSTEEIKKAMGFREDYQLTNKHKLDIHLLGNAVCPPVAKQIGEFLLTRG